MRKTFLLTAALGLTAAAARAQVDTVRATTLPPAQQAEKLYNSGVAKYNAKSYRAALLDFDQALTLRPDFAKAYYNRATTRYELKDYQPAGSSLMAWS
jgi:tetratricopeptide (TPR) repeat protein